MYQFFSRFRSPWGKTFLGGVLFITLALAVASPLYAAPLTEGESLQLAALSQRLATLKMLFDQLRHTFISGGRAQVSSTGSCPSGYHTMSADCMSDSNSSTCQPFGGGATYTCTTYGSTSTYTTGSTYTTTTSSSSSCPSGYHYMGDAGGYCMSDSGGTTCQPTGGGATYTCSSVTSGYTSTSGTSYSSTCKTYTSQESCSAAANTSAACVWYANHYDGSHCDDGAHGASSSSGGTTTSGGTTSTTGTTATTQTTTAFALSDITVTNLTSNSATVSWKTNKFANGKVEFWGPSGTIETRFDSTFLNDHSFSLTDLLANTVYTYKVISEDQTYARKESANNTFTTTAPAFTASCPTGFHSMSDSYGTYCMSDTNSTTCQPIGGGATYTCTYGTSGGGTTATATTTTTTTTGSTDCASRYGSGWHTMDSSGNCFDTGMNSYRTANGTLYTCASTPTTGCSTTTTGSGSYACDSALIALLGDGCHYMYGNNGSPLYCDGPMTKSAKRGDTTTMTGCSDGSYSSSSANQTSHTWRFKDGSTQYSSILSRTDAEYIALIASVDAATATGYFGGWKPGSGNSSNWQEFGIPVVSPTQTSSTTTTGSGSYSCDASLIALLGDGCHYMYYDSSSNPLYCDGPMTKSAKRGDTTATTGCTSPGGTTYGGGGGGVCNTFVSQSTCSTDTSCTWFSGSGYSYCDIKSTYAGDSTSCPGFSYSRWDGSGKRYCQLNKIRACQYNYPDYLDTTKYNAANCPAEDSTGTGTTGSCSSGYHYMGSNYGYSGSSSSYPSSGGGYCMSDTNSNVCQSTGGGTTYTCPGGGTATTTYQYPALAGLSPWSGSVGTLVTISGTGFSNTGNKIYFGSGVIMDRPSSDGRTITFTVPDDQVPLCALTEPRCLLPAPYGPVKPGTYNVWVSNANGSSGSLSFSVIAPIVRETVFSVDPAGTSPRNGEGNTDPSAHIKVKLTKEFDPASTVSQFFKLAKTATPSILVSGAFSILPDSFEFIPSDPLDKETSYLYSVYTTLKDKIGANLSAPFTATFKTSGVSAVQNATLTGKVTDASGTAVARAFVYVYTPSYTFWRNQETSATGEFLFVLPAGSYIIEVSSPGARTDLVRPTPLRVTLTSGERKSVSVQLSGLSKTVSGSVTFSDGKPITDAEIGAYSSETRQWTSALADKDGKYALRLGGGKWFLNVHPRNESSAVWSWSDPPQLLEFTQGGATEVKTANFVIPARDATILVRARDGEGKPLSGIGVVMDSRSASDVYAYTSYYYGVRPEFRTTGADGTVKMSVRGGTYYVRAYLPPDRGYFNPEEEKVALAAGDAKEVALVFRKQAERTSTAIKGTAKIDGAGPTDAFVWAWSERGGFLSTRAAKDGTFALRLLPNTSWHVGAAKEYQGYAYRSSEATLEVKNESIPLDLVLVREGNVPLPATVSVNRDVKETLVAQATDGAKLTLPPSSTGTSGTVNLEINPTVEAPTQAGTRVVGTVYDVTVRDTSGKEVTTLTNDAEIVLPYTEEDIKAQGITEDHLVPSYYDEKAGTWVKLEDCTIDKEKNVAVCRVGHLTRFGLVASADTTPPTAPTGLAAKAAANGAITLTWKNPAADFDHAAIYRSEKAGELGTVRAASVKGVTFTDAGMTNQTVYYYVVRAVDPAGNESTNTAQVTVTAAGTSAASDAAKAPAPASPAVSGKALARNLKQGMRGDDVKVLQNVLRSEGVFSEESTGFFGGLTKQAVIRFQEKYAAEVLTPVGLTKGSGFVGTGTRKKLNAILGY